MRRAFCSKSVKEGVKYNEGIKNIYNQDSFASASIRYSYCLPFNLIVPDRHAMSRSVQVSIPDPESPTFYKLERTRSHPRIQRANITTAPAIAINPP